MLFSFLYPFIFLSLPSFLQFVPVLQSLKKALKFSESKFGVQFFNTFLRWTCLRMYFVFKWEQNWKNPRLGPWGYQFFSASNHSLRRAFKACQWPLLEKGARLSMSSELGKGNGHRATGNGQRATGNGQRATGNGQRATGNGQRATGNGQRATGNGQRATGNGQRATGNGQRATGNGQRATGKRQRATSNGEQKKKWNKYDTIYEKREISKLANLRLWVVSPLAHKG